MNSINSVYLWYSWRFLIVGLLQVLILINLPFGQIQVYLYPMAILLLPLEVPTMVLMLMGFLYGLCIDTFYNTAGLHASALVLLAFVKKWFAQKISPRPDLELTRVLSRNVYGTAWFFQFHLGLMLLHIAWVITLEELTFDLVWLFRVLLSFILSAALIAIYQIFIKDK